MLVGVTRTMAIYGAMTAALLRITAVAFENCAKRLGRSRASLLRPFTWMSEPLGLYLLNLRRMVLNTDCF
jgi:hypothetical protein